ncbi:MAG: cadherin-like domain-containing protein [Thermoleophilia bacterium]|nr:cadherin-like domain-containing protein [Thermoleophilia bacterium]
MVRLWAVLVAAASLLVLAAAPIDAGAAVFNPLLGSDGCLDFSDPLRQSDSLDCAAQVAPGDRDWVNDIAVSPDGAQVYVLTDLAIHQYDRHSGTGALTFAACWSATGWNGCTTISPLLDRFSTIALTPDGAHAYVGTYHGTIAVLDRSPGTGALTPRAAPDTCYGAADTGCTPLRTGQDEISDLTLSPDGTSLYSSSSSAGLFVLERNVVTGALSQRTDELACIGTWTFDWEGDNCVWDGEAWKFDQTRITPDGLHLYAAAEDALYVYDRNAADGTLTQVGCLASSSNLSGCTDMGAQGLLDVHRIDVSADGAQLYTLGDYGVQVWDIDPATGQLARQADPTGCLEAEDHLFTAGCSTIRGMQWPADIEVSADGTRAWVSGDLGLFLFDRDPATGALTQLPGASGCLTPYAAISNPDLSQCNVVDMMVSDWRIAASPDGQNLYAIGDWSDGVTVFGNPAADCRDVSLAERRNDTVIHVDGRCVGLDPDLRTIDVVTSPAHGTITATDPVNGRFTYQPDPAWTGTDTFTYRATDGVTTTATRTVTIPLRTPVVLSFASPPTITGTVAVNSTLGIDTSSVLPSPADIRYTSVYWYLCDSGGGSCSYGGNGTTFNVRASSIGRTIQANVSVTGLDYSSASGTTALTVAVPDPGTPLADSTFVSGVLTVGGSIRDYTAWTNVQSPSTTSTQWQRCTTDLVTCTDIAGQTTSTYVPVPADIGMRLRSHTVVVEPRGTFTSDATTGGVVPANVPFTYATVSTRPAISGAPTTGSTLLAVDATLAYGAIPDSIDYQWRRCDAQRLRCSDVSGATSSSYVLGVADEGYRMLLFQRLWVGSEYRWSYSDATTVVRDPALVGTQPPAVLTAPSVTTPAVYDYVDPDPGTWSGVQPITLSRQWMVCDSAGANCSDVPLPAGGYAYRYVAFTDVGVTYRLRITATNDDGSATATSAATIPVPEPAPVATAASTATGALVEGTTITVSQGSWRSVSAVALDHVEFQDCSTSNSPASSPTTCTPLVDSPSPSLTLPTASIDRYVAWRVHVTNAVGSGVTGWAMIGPIRPAPPTMVVPPTISGTVTEGSTLTATPATWTASRPVVVTATAWLRCQPDGTGCAQVATGSTYVIVRADEQKTLRIAEYAYADAVDDSDQVTGTSSPSSLVPLQPPHELATANFTFYASTTVLRAGTGVGTYVNAPYQWTSPAAITTDVQWLRCDATGAACAPIAGASGASYTTTVADVGSTIRARHRATNAAGTSQHDTNPSAVVTSPPPIALSPASQITGSLVEGQVAAVNPGGGFSSISPVTLGYQWQRCAASTGPCTDVPGATASTYAITTADIGSYLLARTIATNDGGSTTSDSYRTGPVVPIAPTATAAPTITGGAMSGTTATASGAAFSSSVPPTITYEWYSCAPDGSDCRYLRVAPTYDVPVDLVGRRLRVTAHGRTTGGVASIDSAVGPVIVGPPRWSSSPTMRGVLRDGQLVTVDMVSLGTAPLDVTWTWYRCALDGSACAAVAARTGREALLTTADIGHAIRVRVRVANAYGSIEASTPLVAVADEQPAVVGNGSIGGIPRIGQVMTYTPVVWSHAEWSSLQWMRCSFSLSDCAAIAGATSATYAPTAQDVGRWLAVREVGGNPAGTTVAPMPGVGPVADDPTALPIVTPRVTEVTRGIRSVVRWGSTDPVEVSVTSQLPRQSRAGRAVVLGTTTRGRIVLRLSAGQTRCVRLRVHRGDAVGAWSPPACTTRMLPARSLPRRGSWRVLRNGAVVSTRHRSRVFYAARARVTGASIAVRTCRTCGKIEIRWRGRLVRTASLQSGRTRVGVISVPRLRGPGRGALQISVVGSRRPVMIVAVALRLG